MTAQGGSFRIGSNRVNSFPCEMVTVTVTVSGPVTSPVQYRSKRTVARRQETKLSLVHQFVSFFPPHASLTCFSLHSLLFPLTSLSAHFPFPPLLFSLTSLSSLTPLHFHSPPLCLTFPLPPRTPCHCQSSHTLRLDQETHGSDSPCRYQLLQASTLPFQEHC